MVWCTSPVLATISVTVSVLWQVPARSGWCWSAWLNPKTHLLMTRTHTALMRGVRLALTAVTALAILQLLGSSYGSRSGHYPHNRAVRISNTHSRLGSQPQNRKWALAASPREGPRPPQRAGRQMVAAARRGNGDLVLRKTVHQ